MNRILTALFAVALLAGNAASAEAGLHWTAQHNDTEVMKVLIANSTDVYAGFNAGGYSANLPAPPNAPSALFGFPQRPQTDWQGGVMQFPKQ